MIDLSTASVEDIAEELKRRNLSFLLTWCDHNEFNKSPDQGIVWACDSGGNLVLQATLLRFLTKWFRQVEQSRTTPGKVE